MIMVQCSHLLHINLITPTGERSESIIEIFIKNCGMNFHFQYLDFFILYFNFDSQNTVSQQTSNVREELIAKTPTNQGRTEGFKNYFSTILAIAKANNITPFTVKINNDHSRKNSFAKRYFQGEN